MTEHAPKTAALLALEEGLLSDAGRVRIERHLWGCETCRAQREVIQRYQTLTGQVAGAPTPDVDVAALEAKLMEAMRPKRRVRLAGLLAAAVFAAAAFFLVPRTVNGPAPPTARVAQPAPEPAPVEAPAGALRTRVTALAGTVRASHAEHASIDVLVDTELWQGWTLHTAPGSRIDLRLWDGTGISLEGESRLHLAEVAPEGADLVLEYGGVAAQVALPGPEAHFRVSAGGYRVDVKGTRFAVHRLQRGVSANVWEGTVMVTLADGTEVAALAAPSSWSEFGHEPADHEAAPVQPQPFGLGVPLAELGSLELPLAAGIERWVVEDEPLFAGGAIQLRLPRGEHQLVALRSDGQRLLALVQVDGDPLGTRFDPRRLELAPAEEPEPQPAAQPDIGSDTLARVVAEGRGAMQRCYDLELKRRPDARPQLSLRIRLAPSGRVQSVRTRPAGAASDELEQCLGAVARGWSFPAPGTSLTFDAPLRFSARSSAQQSP